MRSVLSILILIILSLSLSAQRICGTDIRDPLSPGSLSEAVLRNAEMRITVVFHIILPEDHESISPARLWSQIDALNRDFNKKNPDLAYADPNFASQIGMTDIEFCLAQNDPSGRQSPGYTEKTTDIENLGQKIFQDGRRQVHYDVLGGTDPWDPEKYLNIWIAEMETFSGRSSFPGEGPIQEDGIVLDPDFIGSFGNTSEEFQKGRTLVHEVGHYLGLLHPWVEEGCETDDGIEDTPMQNGPYFNCPDASVATSCNSRDMVQNFMQYGPDDCLLYFTNGQAEYMHSVLMSHRKGLIDHSQEEDCGGASLAEDPKIYYDPQLMAVRFLSTSPNNPLEMTLMDMSGRILFSRVMEGFHIPTLDMHYYPNGIYLVTVKYDKRTLTQKILKYD